MTDKKNNDLSIDKKKSPQNIQRRQFTLGLSVILGANTIEQLLGRNGLAIALEYERNPTAVEEQSLFNKEQMLTLKMVCQTVIPATETLGAGDVDTHGFIDNQLRHCFDYDAQQSVIATLNLIIRQAKIRYGKTEKNLSTAHANVLISDLDSAQKEFSEKEKLAFRFVKTLIVFGYYTSEEGASKELSYDTYPGGYQPSVALSEIGSAWGSLAYF